MAVHRPRSSILSLKSWLFTPATKADRFCRAAEVHADALIIDLEDAVAVCQPPALMEALAARAEALSVDNVKVYYMRAEEHMKKSLLRYELTGRIKPYCMFMQEPERDLIKKAQGRLPCYTPF
jgi:acyl-CoA hydrolase